jgi:single-strand DNA-binding protein
MNVLTFTGNIGRDCEVRKAGTSTVATFPVAITSGYGERKKTTWVRCSLWGKRAEGGLIKWLIKGQAVAVSGEMSLNEYQAKDGTTKSNVELNVSEVDLIGGAPGTAQPIPQPTPQPAHQPAAQPIHLEDLPF